MADYMPPEYDGVTVGDRANGPDGRPYVWMGDRWVDAEQLDTGGEGETLTEAAGGGGTGQETETAAYYATENAETLRLLAKLEAYAGDPNIRGELGLAIRLALQNARTEEADGVGEVPSFAVLRDLVRQAEETLTAPAARDLVAVAETGRTADLDALFSGLSLAEQQAIIRRVGASPTDDELAAALEPYMPGPDFADVDPIGYTQIVGWLTATTGIGSTQAQLLVQQVAAEKGYTDPYQFLQDEDIQDQAARIAIGNVLPDRFYDETGQFYVNLPGHGPLPVPSGADRVPQPTAPLLRGLPEEEAAAIAGSTGQFTRRVDAPIVPTSELAMLTENERLRQLALRGGGGGGGATLRFDRDAIRSRILERWQRMLIETPDNVDSLVEAYVRAATTYGGQLNVEAWLDSQMQETPRWQMMYEKKPDHLSADEYMTRYRGIPEQLGLPDRAAMRETMAGLRSAASQAGFVERVSRTREAEVSSLGALSRKFADTVAGMGPLMRS